MDTTKKTPAIVIGIGTRTDSTLQKRAWEVAGRIVAGTT